ncbi:MAG: hypothetical protein GY862_00455 [Gammaproteobacteria bacterium]|nr:hypothetical protein [Gammaproteobacteria bacterium]
MQYPLEEKIGHPELLVGREDEFCRFDKWLNNIPRKHSKSRVILARRKSGKTSFVQRVFNRLWSDNGEVIPFYFDIAEKKVWYPDFAVKYFRAFASQYISFLERDAGLVNKLLSLEEIQEYGRTKPLELLVSDVDELIEGKEMKFYDSVWETAYAAPHRYAAILGIKFLVILDEFQNITQQLNITDVRERVPLQRIDIAAESSCGRTVLVEVKKTQTRTGRKAVEDFLEKAEFYSEKSNKKILPAFLSLGGFTKEALQLCKQRGIGTAEKIAWLF